MSKVLISFLGTGPVDNKNKGRNERHYKDASYRFDSGFTIEKSFIALALKEYYKIDRLILIGTVHSMWERVYEEFSNGIDVEYWNELSEFCDEAKHDTPVESFPNQDKLKSAMGDNSEIVLIKYGLTREEILDNQQTILSIERLLDNGDELYVDITHSFRSLPLFLLNSLIYIQNFSKKKIKIKNISYGMLDARSEFPEGTTPVVNLLDILDTSDWLMGAYSFKEFGQSYKLAELLEKSGDKQTSSRLNSFSMAMNLNLLDKIQNQTDLAALRNKEFSSEFTNLIVGPIVEGFSKSFLNAGRDKLFLFQFRLAKWHEQHYNYSSAYICLVESIISFVCHISGKDEREKNEREAAKILIFNHSDQSNDLSIVCDQLVPIYTETNRIRKSIAHSLDEEKRSRPHKRNQIDEERQDTPQYYIKYLKQAIQEFGVILNNC